MGSDRTLPDLFAEVRRRLDALEDHEHSEWVAGGLVALDAIAERQHDHGCEWQYWETTDDCDASDCLALRKACKGEK